MANKATAKNRRNEFDMRASPHKMPTAKTAEDQV